MQCTVVWTYLPVLARRLAGNLGEQLGIQLEVHDLAAVAGGATRQLGADDAEAGQADEAAVGAAQAEQVLAVKVLGLGGSRLLGVVVVGAEDGRHVGRADRVGQARLGRGRGAVVRSAEGGDALAEGSRRGLKRLRSCVAKVRAMLRRVESGRAALVGEGRHYEVGGHCIDDSRWCK